jgi:TolB-like protein
LSFLNELKRRNVLRVGAAYVVISWLLIQVAETIFPLFGLGDGPARLVVIVLAIGLVPSLIFSWVFEITPEGLKKDADVARQHSITQATGKKLDRIILMVLALALGYFAFDKFVLDPARDQARLETARQEGRTEALVESYGDKSIAVLPFVNLSADPEQEYFSDGISEELLNLLAQIPELRVISRSSAFRFKNKDIAIPEVARQLNVAHVLEGSVRKADNRIRITAQLIDARSDTHLWSQTYDRELDNIFAIQDEVATAISQALELKLAFVEEPAVRSEVVETARTAAYDAYLKGRFLAHGSTTDEIDVGLGHLREATRLDPSFAPAYAGIADAMIVKAFFSTSPSAEIVGEARTAAQSAIALNPNLAEAYSALASIRLFFDFDWSGSEDAFLKATSLNPTRSTAYYRYANLLTGLARFDEAVRMAERAVEIDPIGIGALHALGLAKLFGGDFEGAVVAFGNAIEARPDWTWGYVKKSLAHALIGQEAEALALAGETEKLTGGWGSAFLQGWLAWVYSVTHQDELLQRVKERINRGIEENRIEDPFGVALTFLAVGEHSVALDWAERTVNERSPNAVFWNVGTAEYLKLAPVSFRESPRFLELLQRIDLPEN